MRRHNGLTNDAMIGVVQSVVMMAWIVAGGGLARGPKRVTRPQRISASTQTPVGRPQGRVNDRRQNVNRIRDQNQRPRPGAYPS